MAANNRIIEPQLLAKLIVNAARDVNIRGFTVDPKTLKPAKIVDRDLFAVSVAGTERKLTKESSILEVVSWVNKNLILLMLPNHYVGGWRNGKFYLDVTVIIKGMRAAIAAGYFHRQLAIYDFLNDRDIYLKYPKRRTA